MIQSEVWYKVGAQGPTVQSALAPLTEAFRSVPSSPDPMRAFTEALTYQLFPHLIEILGGVSVPAHKDALRAVGQSLWDAFRKMRVARGPVLSPEPVESYKGPVREFGDAVAQALEALDLEANPNLKAGLIATRHLIEVLG